MQRQKGSQSSGDQSDSPVSPSEASTSRAASRSRTAKDAAAEALAAIPWGEEGADNDDESEETRAGRGQDRGDDGELTGGV